jgi:hypothetical protein
MNGVTNNEEIQPRSVVGTVSRYKRAVMFVWVQAPKAVTQIMTRAQVIEALRSD